MDVTISTDGSVFEMDNMLKHTQYVAGGLGIFTVVCTLLSNTVLIFIISTAKLLRRSFFNQIVLSIAVCNWMLGAVWNPMKIDYMFTRKWRFGCWMHIAFQIYEGYIQVFVTSWLLVVYNSRHIMQLLQIRGPEIPRNKVFILKVFVLALPWLLSIIVILPMTIGSLHPLWNQSVWTETYCPVLLSPWAKLLVPCICFFLPAVILLVQCIYLQVLRMRYRTMLPVTSVCSSCVIAATLVSVILTLDEEIFYMIIDYVNWDPTTLIIQWLISQFLADFQKVALPIVWLLTRDISEELNNRLNWPLIGRFVTKENVEVTSYRTYPAQ